MKIRNKRTREVVEISRADFEVRFKKEIKAALESYKRTELSKPYLKNNNSIESSFYFSLQWNFNNYGISNWYIEKI